MGMRIGLMEFRSGRDWAADWEVIRFNNFWNLIVNDTLTTSTHFSVRFDAARWCVYQHWDGAKTAFHDKKSVKKVKSTMHTTRNGHSRHFDNIHLTRPLRHNVESEIG